MPSRSLRFSLLLSILPLFAAPPLPAQVVINEIHYHPRSDLQEDEFIELHNPSGEAADLSGFRFTDGIDFVIPGGTVLPAGGYIVVARDAARIRARYAMGEGQVLGNYDKALSNGGEPLELSDPSGRRVDWVPFGDEFPWPAEPDGSGPSLECIDPTRENDSPRNWRASANRSAWVKVSVEGKATSNRFYLYLEGAGECLIDDITVAASGTEVNLFPEGGFETGFGGWTAAGTHSGSAITTAEARSGGAALHLRATGPGSTAATSVNRAIDALVVGADYVLTFWAKPLSGNASLINRVSGGGLLARTDLRRLEGTPGRENSARSPHLPPLIAEFGVEPPLPAPGKSPVLYAVVEADGAVEVKATYDAGSGPREVQLLDDGLSGDGAAGDGVHGARIPGQPLGRIVEYRVTAADDLGERIETPAARFPVADFAVASALPVYHIFIRPEDWERLNANIWTEEYFPAVFVHEGTVYSEAGLRFRGGRPRTFLKKSLKLSFPDRRAFEGRDKVNLNAAAMDDDFITEPLAYWFYERAGIEASRTRFVRAQLNGTFWGLFIDVEQVDERYLERFALDPEGALYKSVGIVGSLRKLDGVPQNGDFYTYESQYEKKTREGEPHADLIELIDGLHSTPAARMEAFLSDNVEVGPLINYLAASNAMCVWDHIQHNFYLHRDTNSTGRWRVIPWDLDHAWGEWEWNYHFDDTYHVFMGTRAHPFANVWYTWNQLWTVLLDVPSYRSRYQARLRELLNTRFAEGPVFRRIAEMEAEIRETVLLDEAKWPDAAEPQHTGPLRTMAQEIPLLKQNFTRRRQHLARILGVTLETVPAEGRFRRGDANGDSAVNLGDAITVIWNLFLGPVGIDCDDAADADDSGALDLTDGLAILDYLFRFGSPPPAPGPEGCGADGTADELDCDYSNCG